MENVLLENEKNGNRYIEQMKRIFWTTQQWPTFLIPSHNMKHVNKINNVCVNLGLVWLSSLNLVINLKHNLNDIAPIAVQLV